MSNRGFLWIFLGAVAECGYLKTIAGQNTDDSLENDAIKAMVKKILEIVKGF